MAAVRHNLPASLTSFIGRETELAELKTRLADTRLLTLTGVGGGGKTRLSLELARSVVHLFPDGVWLVELGPLMDGDLVPHSVAAAVGVRGVAGQTTIDALSTRLGARRSLLVLDNCEHLLRTAYIAMNLAVVALEQGQPTEALAYLDEASRIAAEFGDKALLAGYSKAFWAWRQRWSSMNAPSVWAELLLRSVTQSARRSRLHGDPSLGAGWKFHGRH